MRKRKQQSNTKMALTYLSIGFVVFIILLPVFWMVSSSLKTRGDLFTYPPEWLPTPIQWGNFIEVFKVAPFGNYLLNTALVSILAVIGVVFSSSLVAFGFARFRFPGRNVLFVILLSTMMLPPQITMIPLFLIFSKFGWINTYFPLIVPVYFVGGFGNAFNVFLMRQFMLSIPKELDEAAKLDGASPLTIYWRIIMPNCIPAVVAVAILAFIYHWNDFLWPLIIINSREKYVLSIGLNALKGSYVTDWNLLMAAAMMSVLPILIVFYFLQRYYIRGVTITGLK